MSNPRKFSEKIALITQKQAEQTAAFEQIMKEVMDATASKPAQPPDIVNKQQGGLLHPVNLGVYRGGSLPNVNSMSQNPDKSSQSGKLLFNQGSVSPRSSKTSLGPDRVKHRQHHSPYPSSQVISGHSMSPNHSTGNIAGSPVLTNFGNYLTPPQEQSWRRANSDSALNAINSSQLLIPSVVPDSSEESSNNSNDPRDNYGLTMGKLPPQDSPQHDGQASLLEIPTSVSTGSLPDLTTFQQFQQSIHQQTMDPLDPEIQLNHSPYSTSPLTGSSLAYSPSLSPHPSTGVMNHHQTSQPLVNHHQTSPQQSQVQRPQPQQTASQQQPQQIARSPQSPHQNILENPLNAAVNSFQNFPTNDNIYRYRSPQRPSPQNSPQPFRSSSPLEGQLSGPASPTNQSQQQQSADSYFLSQQANALQQHFEQISMGDQSPQRNNGHCNWQGGMVNSSLPYFFNPAAGATAGVPAQQSPQQPPTPQTPSSIPDIIFTEFLGTDFNERATSEQVEAFLASDAAADALREGLGPLDLDGPMLEMLQNPNLVQLDSNAEDSFRLDRL